MPLNSWVLAGLSVMFALKWALALLPLTNGAASMDGMNTSMMARMKELEAENTRLKKMYIEEKAKGRDLE